LYSFRGPDITGDSIIFKRQARFIYNENRNFDLVETLVVTPVTDLKIVVNVI